MYHHVASSVRSKLTLRGASSSLATSHVALPLSYTTPSATRMVFAAHPTNSYYRAPTHQATLSLSMFATVGSAAGDGTSSTSNEQRRPFWATRPVEDETNKVPTTSVSTINHSVHAAAVNAGISMEDIKKAVIKAKRADPLSDVKPTKKAAAKKKKAKKEAVEEDDDEEEEEEVDDMVDPNDDDDDDDAEIKLPPDTDSITTLYMAQVIAAKYKMKMAQSKRIVHEIFDMVIDVRVSWNMCQVV